MRTTTISRGIRSMRIMLAMIVLVLMAATLSIAPKARAWSTFTEWYAYRTANSVAIYWTVRGQEDSPGTPAEQFRLCWTTDLYDYPCNSQGFTSAQYMPVGGTNSYLITGLGCSAYRVMIGQPYLLAESWDWDEHTISIPACSDPPAGPLLWLRADSIAQSSGSNVSFWADQSGYGRNATMSIVSRQPTFITGMLNGQPIVRFNGAQSLSLASPVSPQQFTVFVVGKNSKSTETFSMILGPGGLWPNNQIRWENGSQALFVGTSNGLPVITSNIGNTRVYHALSARYDGSTMTVYRDGNLTSSHGFSTYGPWTLAQVGAWYSSYYLLGDLAEILVYGSALSESDRSAANAYLRSKYALP